MSKRIANNDFIVDYLKLYIDLTVIERYKLLYHIMFSPDNPWLFLICHCRIFLQLWLCNQFLKCQKRTIHLLKNVGHQLLLACTILKHSLQSRRQIEGQTKTKYLVSFVFDCRIDLDCSLEVVHENPVHAQYLTMKNLHVWPFSVLDFFGITIMHSSFNTKYDSWRVIIYDIIYESL